MTEHTCLQGPLCSLAYAWLNEPREETPLCDHHSCGRLIHEDCRACFSEAMEESERQWQQYLIVLPYLNRLLCPVDMTELECRGVVAAPGYGTSFECHCSHYWLHARGTWYSEAELREYVPELTIWDVM